MSFANARYRFGQLQQNDPSRFIDEIPEQYVDKTYAGSPARNNAASGWAAGNAFERMNRGFGNQFKKKNLPNQHSRYLSQGRR